MSYLPVYFNIFLPKFFLFFRCLLSNALQELGSCDCGAEAARVVFGLPPSGNTGWIGQVFLGERGRSGRQRIRKGSGRPFGSNATPSLSTI